MSSRFLVGRGIVVYFLPSKHYFQVIGFFSLSFLFHALSCWCMTVFYHSFPFKVYYISFGSYGNPSSMLISFVTTETQSFAHLSSILLILKRQLVQELTLLQLGSGSLQVVVRAEGMGGRLRCVICVAASVIADNIFSCILAWTMDHEDS